MHEVITDLQPPYLHVYGSCSLARTQIMQNISMNNWKWLKALKGAWSLAYKSHRKTVLATDGWGTRPLFYAVHHGAVLFSENIDEILNRLPHATTDKDALARFLLEDFSHPEDTVFREIKKVPQGTVVIIENGRVESVKWTKDLAWQPVHNDINDTANAWGHELTEHLKLILPQHEKWGVFVSGGLDSTGLVALSMELIKKHGWPVTLELYSMTTEHPESDDQGFCQKLSCHYKIPLFQHCTTPEELNKLFLKSQTTPSALPFFPTLQMFEPLMQKAHDNRCTGLLFGYGADEQWTLNQATLDLDFLSKPKTKKEAKKKDWSRFFQSTKSRSFKHYLSIFHLWARQRAPNFLKIIFHYFINAGVPLHLKPCQIFKDQRKILKIRIQQNEKNFTSFSQKQLFLRNFVSGNNQQNLTCHISLAKNYGLEVHFPYLAPEMLNISLFSSCELLYAAQDKLILRMILKPHLLEEIRTAPKFQDYCQLGHKTALQVRKHTPNLFCLLNWIQPNVELAHFDNDSFFEILYAEKMMKTYGADDEKEKKTLSKAKN